MKRPIQSARGMPPILRDVHPEKVPVELYAPDGRIILRADLDARLIASVDRAAAQTKVSFQSLMLDAVKRTIRAMEDSLGLGDEEKGGG